MGVNECNRLGCENICCNRLSNTFGYICGDCFIELLDRAVKYPDQSEIDVFMKTPKTVTTEEYHKRMRKVREEALNSGFKVF